MGFFSESLGNHLTESVDAIVEQQRIVEHHTREASSGNHGEASVDKHTDGIVSQLLLVELSFHVMIEPVVVETVYTRTVLLRQLLLELAQFAEHTVVAHAAQRGNTAEADGQEVETACYQIASLDGTKQTGKDDLQALYLATLLTLRAILAMHIRI